MGKREKIDHDQTLSPAVNGSSRATATTLRPSGGLDDPADGDDRQLVVVADDDPDICAIVERHLTQVGYSVTTASDGETALAAVRETAPALVIADWTMPVLSGPELCVELRRDEELADTPVIILTARSLEADIVRGFAVGATDYIVKPFAMGELLARVEAATRVPR